MEEVLFTDVIILAGGFGERLWPASSPLKPKQFMALNDNISFFQESLRRALALKISGKIVVVTRKDIEQECISQICSLAACCEDWEAKKLLGETIVLAEPCPKHTSAAVMSGVELVRKIHDDKKHVFLVLTSDHVISPLEKFVSDCKEAFEAAENENFVCFSIVPSYAGTGYGYIKAGKDLSEGRNILFRIDEFKEKPDAELAEKYLESGNYFWNSGMFAFEGNMFLSEMKKCTPEISKAYIPVEKGGKPVLKRKSGVYYVETWNELEDTYQKVPAVALDKSLAEKTKNAAVVRSCFDWTDVGSWDTFSSLCTNPVNGKVVQVASENNFVYSDFPVSLCGVKDLIVVVKNGSVLVMKKGESALVREAVKKMESV